VTFKVTQGQPSIYAIYDFLLFFHCHRVSILYLFRHWVISYFQTFKMVSCDPEHIPTDIIYHTGTSNP